MTVFIKSFQPIRPDYLQRHNSQWTPLDELLSAVNNTHAPFAQYFEQLVIAKPLGKCHVG